MLTEQDVKSLMQHSSLKSCVLDPMPSTLIGQPVCPTSCTYKIDQYVLEVWSIFCRLEGGPSLTVTQKTGLNILFKNFGPVSNLPFVSKLTESAVYNQSSAFLL